MDFLKFKEEVLRRAKAASVSLFEKEYSQLYKTEYLTELMQVLKDNFHYAVIMRIVDRFLIKEYRSIFKENEIYYNVDASSGYLLVTDDVRVIASGNVKAWATGNSEIEAYDNADVIALDRSVILARDNSAVIVYDDSTVIAYDSATVMARDSTIVRKYGENVFVQAEEDAYVISVFDNAKIDLSDSAIHRIIATDTIKYNSDKVVFKKQKKQDNDDGHN